MDANWGESFHIQIISYPACSKNCGKGKVIGIICARHLTHFRTVFSFFLSRFEKIAFRVLPSTEGRDLSQFTGDQLPTSVAS